MSTLRVQTITNRTDDGPIEFTKGANLPANQSIVDENGNNPIVINAIGVVTATSFQGSGSEITGLTGAPKGRGIGIVYLVS